MTRPKVLIATPTMTGTPDYRYTLAMFDVKEQLPEYELYTVQSQDANLIRCRALMMLFAIEQKFDELMFIDDDHAWTPAMLKRALSHDEPFVVAPYMKKHEDRLEYCLQLAKSHEPDTRGLLPILWAGCGFMRIRIDACRKLYRAAPVTSDGNNHFRMVFNHGDVNGNFVTEDSWVCGNWIRMGGQVLLDCDNPIPHCHAGGKVYFRQDFLADLPQIPLRG